MNDTKREELKAKIAKLMNLGKDGRGNANEQNAALEHANRLMAEYGISEAEFDTAQLDANETVFGEADCGHDGKAPQAGKVYRSMPHWCGIIAIGIARFTDCVVKRRTTEHGEMLVFQGEKNDVLFARWLQAVLVANVQAAQKESGWTARGDAGSFRSAAASTLQKRLRDLYVERQAMYRKAQAESNSKALMVVDRKLATIADKFGEQRTSKSRTSYSSSGAFEAGRSAGNKINIPSGRPLGSNKSRLIA